LAYEHTWTHLALTRRGGYFVSIFGGEKYAGGKNVFTKKEVAGIQTRAFQPKESGYEPSK
jgi:hypothetical protein